MKIEVKKIGNSTGVILPKELLGKLQIKQGDWLFVTELPDGGLMLAPRDPSLPERAREDGPNARRTGTIPAADPAGGRAGIP